MKHLEITYGGVTLFSGEVVQFNWSENEQGVQVAGQFTKPESWVEKLQTAAKEKRDGKALKAVPDSETDDAT